MQPEVLTHGLDLAEHPAIVGVQLGSPQQHATMLTDL
jgi:hypothetical protein